MHRSRVERFSATGPARRLPETAQAGHLIRRLTLTLYVPHAVAMASRATNVMRQGL